MKDMRSSLREPAMPDFQRNLHSQIYFWREIGPTIQHLEVVLWSLLLFQVASHNIYSYFYSGLNCAKTIKESFNEKNPEKNENEYLPLGPDVVMVFENSCLNETTSYLLTIEMDKDILQQLVDKYFNVHLNTSQTRYV